MQGIYTYIPETNNVPKEYNVAAILSLLFIIIIIIIIIIIGQLLLCNAKCSSIVSFGSWCNAFFSYERVYENFGRTEFWYISLIGRHALFHPLFFWIKMTNVAMITVFSFISLFFRPISLTHAEVWWVVHSIMWAIRTY
jgi:hypothetical protein